MLRVLLHGLVAALLCLAAPLAVAQGVAGDAPGAYVAGIPDLPLMPGLKELPPGGLVFDTPGGRIGEAFNRQSGVSGKRGSVRVALGGRRIINKTNLIPSRTTN